MSSVEFAKGYVCDFLYLHEVWSLRFLSPEWNHFILDRFRFRYIGALPTNAWGSKKREVCSLRPASMVLSASYPTLETQESVCAEKSGETSRKTHIREAAKTPSLGCIAADETSDKGAVGVLRPVPNFVRTKSTDGVISFHVTVDQLPEWVTEWASDVLKNSASTLEQFEFIGTSSVDDDDEDFLPPQLTSHHLSVRTGGENVVPPRFISAAPRRNLFLEMPRLRRLIFYSEFPSLLPLPSTLEHLREVTLDHRGWHRLAPRLAQDAPPEKPQHRRLFVNCPFYDCEKPGLRLLQSLGIKEIVCGPRTTLQTVIVYIGAFSVLRELGVLDIKLKQYGTTVINPSDAEFLLDPLCRLIAAETAQSWKFKISDRHVAVLRALHLRLLTQDFIVDLVTEVCPLLEPRHEEIAQVVANWMQDRFFAWSLVPKGYICGTRRPLPSFAV
eukprot:Blabericola_migrator_1__4856@NODE_2543_length_2625_cov_309_411650_g1590_i0_p1_GENE_NODE_2543_length_2625_cov_309_411650_g1590_i0NODE_2543_length_2625_cov_309_411650_g1590_i0_p1_ORF_typecomplete_len443_score46_13_NODE_2543_length_2625_cov_309_411650_g1590_i02101538